MKAILLITGWGLAGLAALAAAAWIALRRPDIPFDTLEARYAAATSRYIELPGDLRVHYRDDGPRDAPVLILVHGFGDSFLSWSGWIDVLKADFRVLSVDIPGHGLTRAPGGYVPSGQAHSAFVINFADALGLERYAIAGNSMGGGIAWRVALADRGRVSGLVLMNAAGFANDQPSPPPLAFRLLGTPFGRFLLERIETRPLTSAGLKMNVADDALITPAFVDRWVAVQRAPGHRPILMRGAPGAPATGEALATITAPTLVMWGADDPLLHVSNAAKFANAILGAETIIYPNIGHMPQLEVPEQSARDAAAFLLRTQ